MENFEFGLYPWQYYCINFKMLILKYDAQQCSKQLVGWDGNEVPWQICSSVTNILHPLIVCTTVAHSPPWFVEVMVLWVWRRIILVFGYKLTRAILGSIWGEVLRFLQLSISSRGLSIDGKNVANGITIGGHTWMIYRCSLYYFTFCRFKISPNRKGLSSYARTMRPLS